ncbi:hypothetical protein PS676_01455 [Pseudomonas fluorescens]|jgi:hypothetical protein|nr:hypothetical protein PS676_01455 [Pseudomonas fluorescens]
MSGPLLRYFTQAFKPLAYRRETLVPAGFSKKFNDLQYPGKACCLGYCRKLIR